ncbi:unnamed protein product [Rotaria magnacalcarata]|uniref:Uncharacterized protein n=2 Tax=Rotaria magnacalcarata TaxID=392030 RepID=A0A816D846_9BILA|nr:unnamed protein product [Rotaria magnacalcarata]
MNSLQFSNDVIQISHPTISRHLIQYIYHGFLVAVFGSSIHQAHQMDSGIHEDGLDTNSQTEIHPIITKSTTDEFQLPS